MLNLLTKKLNDQDLREISIKVVSKVNEISIYYKF